MKYVYSTLSCDQNFSVYEVPEDPKRLPIRKAIIVVKGMANIVDKKTFVTPKGAVTQLEDGQVKELEKLPQFKRFVERGFITVETKQADADAAAKNMTAKDKSAQKTEADLKKTAKTATAKVTTNKAEDK